MSGSHRIIGAELSPYSVKVRSYFQYKAIPHAWVPRDARSEEEYKKYAKLPIVPLVITPDGEGVQDSTPIIERFEAEFPQPGIHPEDPRARFASVLLEEFGDEWGNKWMFHLRWAREADQISAASRLAAGFMGIAASDEAVLQTARQLRERMVPRVSFVGSNPQTAPLIEASFKRGLALLDAHLQGRSYLFGERPSFADFGLWAQIYSAWLDPTGFAWINHQSYALLQWVQRMQQPHALGEFQSWDELQATLQPLLSELVGGQFLPWSVANASALAAGEESFSVELPIGTWTQQPVKYQAKSLKALQEKYQALADRNVIDAMLDECGCLQALQALQA